MSFSRRHFNCRAAVVLALAMAVAVLPSSRSLVYAFTTSGGSAAATKQRAIIPRRVLILPDSRAPVEQSDLWHHHLKARVLAENVASTIEDMPDPYAFNTKRYETFWTGFMADELALCPNTLVVAHGTAADAVLRFVETHEVWGAVLVCPGGEMYHAGERHGRAYVWPRIRRGCKWIAVVHATEDPIVGDAEARRVKDALGVPSALFREVAGGQRRLRDRSGHLLEVEEFVVSALAHMSSASAGDS